MLFLSIADILKHLQIANFVPGADGYEEVREGGTTVKRRKASAHGYHDGEKRVLPNGPITFHTQ